MKKLKFLNIFSHKHKLEKETKLDVLDDPEKIVQINILEKPNLSPTPTPIPTQINLPPIELNIIANTLTRTSSVSSVSTNSISIDQLTHHNKYNKNNKHKKNKKNETNQISEINFYHKKLTQNEKGIMKNHFSIMKKYSSFMSFKNKCENEYLESYQYLNSFDSFESIFYDEFRLTNFILYCKTLDNEPMKFKVKIKSLDSIIGGIEKEQMRRKNSFSNMLVNKFKTKSLDSIFGNLKKAFD